MRGILAGNFLPLLRYGQHGPFGLNKQTQSNDKRVLRRRHFGHRKQAAPFHHGSIGSPCPLKLSACKKGEYLCAGDFTPISLTLKHAERPREG